MSEMMLLSFSILKVNKQSYMVHVTMYISVCRQIRITKPTAGDTHVLETWGLAFFSLPDIVACVKLNMHISISSPMHMITTGPLLLFLHYMML